MSLTKETETFTTTDGLEYNYDTYSMTLRGSDLTTRKYVLITKYNQPLASVTVHHEFSVRVTITPNTNFTKDTFRILSEFLLHIASKD